MNFKQKSIHARALAAARRHQKSEFEMILALQEVDAVQLYKFFRLSSLFKYAVKYLKLTDPVALAFMAVARKSTEVPQLKEALETGLLSVSAANRIVSTLNKENAAELIQFVSTHNWRENEREIAKRNPKAAAPTK